MQSPELPANGALPPDATVTQARDWLRDQVEVGAHCPVCTQLAKVYRRKLNSGMAHALIRFWQVAGRDWAHKPTVLRGVGAAARDESLLRYWGLMEEEQERRPDGGRAGWWRVTDDGERFIHARSRLPKYARIYDGRLLSLDWSETLSIREALGSRFNYDELMAGY